jgi:hypothetical protein
MKLEDTTAILEIQQTNRRQRVTEELLTLKKKFNKKYKKILDKMLLTSKTKITDFLNQKINKTAVESKFKRFKDTFYAPPTPGIMTYSVFMYVCVCLYVVYISFSSIFEW